ncbi:DUF4286 family protein [Chelativorans xinjiangense]|uniref:DUF4286 family protein n=1 Tax=Chelativorans xinjiangense TaxID=2681485 RepID=UPI0013576657|nr:DUF4286 family protein [Chelativorans xinjiangense]
MSQFHIVLVDVDPAVEDAFNEWYETVHIPEILACPGWLSAQRHVCVEGGPKYAAVYEITGSDAYETPEFHAIKGFGPFESHVSNFKRLRLSPLALPASPD